MNCECNDWKLSTLFILNNSVLLGLHAIWGTSSLIDSYWFVAPYSFIPSGASCDMGNLILDRLLLMLRPVFIHSFCIFDQVVDNTTDLLGLKYSLTNIQMLGGDWEKEFMYRFIFKNGKKITIRFLISQQSDFWLVLLWLIWFVIIDKNVKMSISIWKVITHLMGPVQY